MTLHIFLLFEMAVYLYAMYINHMVFKLFCVFDVKIQTNMFIIFAEWHIKLNIAHVNKQTIIFFE